LQFHHYTLQIFYHTQSNLPLSSVISFDLASMIGCGSKLAED
jgi:hypothetical protein